MDTGFVVVTCYKAVNGVQFPCFSNAIMIYPEFDKEKASPEGPEMPKYKVDWRKAKEIRNAQFMDNM